MISERTYNELCSRTVGHVDRMQGKVLAGHAMPPEIQNLLSPWPASDLRVCQGVLLQIHERDSVTKCNPELPAEVHVAMCSSILGYR